MEYLFGRDYVLIGRLEELPREFIKLYLEKEAL